MAQSSSPAAHTRGGKPARLIALIAIVVLIIAGIAVVQAGARQPGPATVVRSYLDKIAAGDAEGALALADLDIPEGKRQLLTDEILEKAHDLPYDITVGDTETNGDTARVTVEYRLAGNPHTATFELYKVGKRMLFFDEWRLRSPQLGLLKVPTGALAEADVNGMTVPAGGEANIGLPVFPGTYTVTGVVDSQYYSAAAVTVAATFGAEATGVGGKSATLKVLPTQALTDEIDKQVKKQLDDCAAADDPRPPECPEVFTEHKLTRDVERNIDTYPQLRLGGVQNFLFAEADVTGEGDNAGNYAPVWKFRSDTPGQVRLTGDEFDRTVWVPFDYQGDMWVSGTVRVSGDSVEITYDS